MLTERGAGCYGRYQAVLMDFGSVREARVHVTTRAEALALQVYPHAWHTDVNLVCTVSDECKQTREEDAVV